MKFDGVRQHELTNALAEAFSDDQSLREMLMCGFGSQIVARLSESGHRQQIADAIRFCGERDRHDQLVRVARRANPDSPPLLEFERRKQHGFNIRTEHLVQLERLVVTPLLDLNAVRDAAGPFEVTWAALADPEDVSSAFRRNADWLARLPRAADQTLPLYTFGYDLARRVGREVEVHEWARSLGMGQLELPQRRPAASLYLFVKCTPAYAAGGEFDSVHVEMWLWRLDETGNSIDEAPKKVAQRTEAAVPIEQVPKLISDVRKSFSRDLVIVGDNLQIALCMSQTALPVEVERWRIEYGTTPCELRSLYPVAFRSYERLYGGRDDTWGRWRKRWKAIRSGNHDLPVFWADESRSEMHFTDEVARRDVVCAALTHAAGVALVASTIDAGVPAVVWTRGSQHESSTVRSRLEPLLTKSLVDLPVLLHERRAEADPFDRIAILWEPYHLRPPDTWWFAAPERM